jgi:hypothetical protein
MWDTSISANAKAELRILLEIPIEKREMPVIMSMTKSAAKSVASFSTAVS